MKAMLEMFANIGRKILYSAAKLGRGHLLFWKIMAGFDEILRRPSLLIRQIFYVGVLSVLLISLSGFFVGMVLGLQGFYTLSQFGAEATLGVMVAASFSA